MFGRGCPFEALSFGCPVIATAVGGMKEIIKHGYNGFLSEPESPESIAEMTLDLLNNNHQMLEFSKNAILDCELNYSPKIIAQKTLDFYNNLL